MALLTPRQRFLPATGAAVGLGSSSTGTRSNSLPLCRTHLSSRVRLSSSQPPAIPLVLFPNALRRKGDPAWRGGFSLGVDVGDARTGLAVGKGFAPRPLTVVEQRGQKLELRLIDIAEREEVDEFIVGLPLSLDGKETPQSNKVRSIAGRLAVCAAERGLRVYLQNEMGTSLEALDFMITKGVQKQARRARIDAYSALMLLERYFATSGEGAELVLPKQLELQEKLRVVTAQADDDFYMNDM